VTFFILLFDNILNKIKIKIEMIFIFNVVIHQTLQTEENKMIYAIMQEAGSLARFLGGEFFLFIFMVMGFFYLNHVARQTFVRPNAGVRHSASVCRYR